MLKTQVGVALFRDHPNAMFPFSAMDEGQRKYVEGVVASCMAQFARQRDAAVSVNNSSSIAANVVMQMGGGCILYAESSSGGVTSSAGPCSSNRGSSSQQQLLLRPKDVFETLCDCIFASKRCVGFLLLLKDDSSLSFLGMSRYGSARVRYAVCSLVMQRVVGMMHVARADQQAVHLYALKLLKREGEEEFECDE